LVFSTPIDCAIVNWQSKHDIDDIGARLVRDGLPYQGIVIMPNMHKVACLEESFYFDDN